MMKKIDLSIIIVTWNSAGEIHQCLSSLISYLPCKNYEILIVDNNSTDNTVEIIQDFNHGRVTLFSLQKNLGFAKANNFALPQANGDFVLFINPDTITTEDMLTPMLNRLAQKDTDIGLISCKLRYEDGSYQKSVFSFETPMNLFLENTRLPMLFPEKVKQRFFPSHATALDNGYYDWVIGALMLARTDLIKFIGGFSEDYFMYTEDMDLCKKIELVNKRIYYLADVSIIHLAGKSENKNYSYKKSERLLANKLIFLNKFYGKATVERGRSALRIGYLIKVVVSGLKYFVNRDPHSKTRLNSMRHNYTYISNHSLGKYDA